MRRRSARFVTSTVAISGILALSGMVFGYFIGLPTALYFLLHQFVNAQIHPLLTIDAYLSFVLVYMLGSALMFQVPLIILFINRIKPLTPRGLWKRERWAILFAVILGGLMNPTPNLLDQLFVIGPIIASYQLGIVLVWWQNRRPKRLRHIESLRERDIRIQAERLERSRTTRPMTAEPLAATAPIVSPLSPSNQTARPRQYANTFSPERRTALLM
jgi:sec-independent protein translocase protein TatC